jgi:benzoate membrane transport protein
VPLILVSLTGQFLPGMAILHGSGYPTPAADPRRHQHRLADRGLLRRHHHRHRGHHRRPCTGKDAHEDPSRRYVAGIANGAFYLIGGFCGATIVSLFTLLPKEFVAVLAGLALIGAITANIMGAVNQEDHREASVITFLPPRPA